jgi:Lhr-like helicase
MTKNDLLEIIFKEYDVQRMVKINISNSVLDNSYEDLSQEIYLILYELPFSRLYYLYTRNQMPNYITGIIKHQRNSPYLQYNKLFKLYDRELSEFKECWEEPDDKQEDNFYLKMETINEMLHKKYPIERVSDFNKKEMREFFSIEIYKLYLKKKFSSNFSFTRLSKELGISRNLISDSIQLCKQLIRDEYKNKIKK